MARRSAWERSVSVMSVILARSYQAEGGDLRLKSNGVDARVGNLVARYLLEDHQDDVPRVGWGTAALRRKDQHLLSFRRPRVPGCRSAASSDRHHEAIRAPGIIFAHPER